MKISSVCGFLVVMFGLISVGTIHAQQADFVVDGVHSSAVFKIERTGLSWMHGRFNKLSGEFSTGPNTAFVLITKTDSIDTGNAQRDQHLKAPDFFNARQFPEIVFKSTAIKQTNDGYEATGLLSLHGVSKPITVLLKGGKTQETPQGILTGFTGEFVIKRSDFGIGQSGGPIGDEVFVTWSFEGKKK